MWTFDLSLRYAKGISPAMKAAYGYGDSETIKTLHLPGQASYVGYTYPRSLIDPVHESSVTLAKKSLEPFSSHMLRDIPFNESKLSIFPDPWNASPGRAWNIVKNRWEENDEVTVTNSSSPYRVYLPTYVVHYSVWGVEYV